MVKNIYLKQVKQRIKQNNPLTTVFYKLNGLNTLSPVYDILGNKSSVLNCVYYTIIKGYVVIIESYHRSLI